jgi:hypothetical protein
MDAPDRKSWMRAVILVSIVYFVVGMVFAALANAAVSDQVRIRWRLAAWLASAAVYAAHIGYEHFWFGNSPRGTAWHAALAVALGAFLIAVAATVHKVMVVSHAPYWRFLLALVLWPMITALPAFLVALAAAAVLGRLPTKHWAG